VCMKTWELHISDELVVYMKDDNEHLRKAVE